MLTPTPMRRDVIPQAVDASAHRRWRVARHRRLAVRCAACLVLTLCGCVPETRYAETAGDYQRASNTLGLAAGELFAHANTVEAESYIDTQAFLRQPLSQAEVDGRAILSADGIRLRQKAIEALSAYTRALASVASGKPEDKVAEDATTAGAGLAGLTVDLQAALTKDGVGTATASYSGVVQAAASAAGQLIQILEKRHSREALRASLRKNDPAMTALFTLVGTDAERIYVRQRLGVENRGVTMYGRYAAAIQATGNEGYVMAVGERIQRFRRESDQLAGADPAPAFAAWKRSHDDLVAALLNEEAGKPGGEPSMRRVMEDVQIFAISVQPLASNLQLLTAAI